MSIQIFKVVAPIDEIKVIAKEVAMVILVGIFNTTSMIGTNKNAPAAPTIPPSINKVKTHVPVRL